MSTDSSKGSSGKSDDVLAAILKRLNAMDERLQAMDEIKEMVTTLEASTSELGAQQDTLFAAVERIDLAQTQLVAKVGRGDMT
jgi:hypothetical protein